ncbi:hypothetical protein CMV_013920 [Castanea mollissima]|uniref:Uncharacterized protein n=1 Tax=Castanea mollissima TaxID=60419 RepID=A0A8J4RCJ9_9ROSI|nr:hypothetical protein CMV_013920 [Castanea mollissima]
MLKLTREQVEVLKKRANQDVVGVTTIRPYSRYEAIAGHMWRCACKVRAVDSHNSQSTRARLAVDIRNRLKPSLPERYFGNATLGTVTPICLYKDLLSKPLSYSAGKLREATERMDDEYIRSALDFISSQKDVSGLRSNFQIQGYSEAPFLGNPNISLGSWIGLPFYDADFGWGKPIYVGPAALLHMDGFRFEFLGDGCFDWGLGVGLAVVVLNGCDWVWVWVWVWHCRLKLVHCRLLRHRWYVCICSLHQNLAPIFTTLQGIIPRGLRVEALIKFIHEKFDCSWQVIWSCLLHGIPMFSSVTAVVDAVLMLLGSIISYVSARLLILEPHKPHYMLYVLIACTSCVQGACAVVTATISKLFPSLDFSFWFLDFVLPRLHYERLFNSRGAAFACGGPKLIRILYYPVCSCGKSMPMPTRVNDKVCDLKIVAEGMVGLLWMEFYENLSSACGPSAFLCKLNSLQLMRVLWCIISQWHQILD